MSGSCAKCGGSMEEGFLRDTTYGGTEVQTWSEGTPQRSIWTGIKKADVQYEIRAMRCTRCGLLESYAN